MGGGTAGERRSDGGGMVKKSILLRADEVIGGTVARAGGNTCAPLSAHVGSVIDPAALPQHTALRAAGGSAIARLCAISRLGWPNQLSAMVECAGARMPPWRRSGWSARRQCIHSSLTGALDEGSALEAQRAPVGSVPHASICESNPTRRAVCQRTPLNLRNSFIFAPVMIPRGWWRAADGPARELPGL